MSDYWHEFSRRVAAFHEAGDADRLRLIEYHYEGFRCQETDPERSLALFTQGRDDARRLEEPWWVLFYESWRLTAVTSYIMDFTRALPLAMELMVRFNTPEGQAHPDRLGVLNNVLYTYLNTDPLGYRDELERGFAYLDGEIAEGPNGRRFVLYHRWGAYLMGCELWDEAYAMLLRSLALLDRCREEHTRVWHTAWALDQLCSICHELGRLDEMAGHAEHLVELSQKRHELRRTQAAGWIWRAVAHRTRGEEKAASRAFHRGMALLDGLARRDTICGDGLAAYYEAGGDLKAALGVRDRQLAEVARNGMSHAVCIMRIERCRLLARAGELTAEDLDAARLAAGQLRTPAWYLEKLDRIDPAGNRNGDSAPP